MHHKKVFCSIMIAILFMGLILQGPTTTFAKSSIYEQFDLASSYSKLTIYVGEKSPNIFTSIRHSITDKFDEDDYSKATEKILDDLKISTSNASVVGIIESTNISSSGESYSCVKSLTGSRASSPRLLGLSEGTATITVSSSLLGEKKKIAVTVKNAELTCQDEVFYTGNTYAFCMRGNAKAVSFKSSNTKVASIDKKTGKVTAKAAGSTTLSCKADDGKTYKYKMKVSKCGLSYTSLTAYYFTGMDSSGNCKFPLVAKGIDVKSWKSSDTKVCKLKQYGNVCILWTTGTGKCKITCTSKSGKKYTCKLTVAGGKKWGGLSGGYRPTISEVKKHGYYDDINSILDYGTCVVEIVDYANEIDLGNGNTHNTFSWLEPEGKLILKERYPDKTIQQASGGDYILFTKDDGTKMARIWVQCYYVE